MNSGAWEKVTHDLAALCGLRVPESKLETYSEYGSTFLVKRFDRNQNHRIHFTSAMTMLSKTDGSQAMDGSSYLEITDFIRSAGAKPQSDLRELWKRIVFSMTVSNTDDHLRNHGFLLQNDGWHLSPLFDVNPSPVGEFLSLNINELDNRIDLDLALEVANDFDITQVDAQRIIAEMTGIAWQRWEAIARMEPAFAIAEQAHLD